MGIIFELIQKMVTWWRYLVILMDLIGFLIAHMFTRNWCARIWRSRSLVIYCQLWVILL